MNLSLWNLYYCTIIIWNEMRVKSLERMMNRQTTRLNSTQLHWFLSILDKVVRPSRRNIIHSQSFSLFFTRDKENTSATSWNDELIRLELEFRTCKSTHCVCTLFANSKWVLVWTEQSTISDPYSIFESLRFFVLLSKHFQGITYNAILTRTVCLVFFPS